jgi:dTDP-glucose pyrophosphorylase
VPKEANQDDHIRMNKIQHLFVSPQTSLREVIDRINETVSGIAIVTDDQRHLEGVITDGDIRRHILKGLGLADSAQKVLDNKIVQSPPITAHYQTPLSITRGLLKKHSLRHIPLLDDEGCVVDMVFLDDLLSTDDLPIQAMVLAGGVGSRLQSLTNTCPKPMLPLGERPLLEHIIQQLSKMGIRRINVATHYLAEQIVDHFGDGSNLGVELNYVSEERPLGTAGALGVMGKVEEPLLVINGDILTKINFHSMLVYHLEHQAELTMAVRKYDFDVPYGVVECEGVAIKELREKPSMSFFVNAGVYLLQPSVYSFINNGESLDMTDLIQRLLDASRSVISFPVLEYWVDIGQLADYERAQEDMKEGIF